MAEITINKKSCIVAGLDNGSIFTMYCNDNKLQLVNARNDHIKSISSFSVSPCNKYLISSGADCMTFIYQSGLLINGVRQEEDGGNNSVDDFLADVVLYPKK